MIEKIAVPVRCFLRAIITSGVLLILLSCGGSNPETPGLPTSEQIADFGSLPRWSPDGQKLAFGADGVQAGIWVYNRGSGDLIQIVDTSNPHLYDYRWSPQSDQIAFGGAGATVENTSGIFVAELDGSAPVRWHATGHSPSWTPDGSGLVFAEEDQQFGIYGIFRLAFSDSTLDRLTMTGTDPQYNFSGTQIAYRDPFVSGSYLYFRLKVMPALGGSETSLADTCSHFNWTGDGGTLVFDYLQPSGGMRISSVPVSGGSISTILFGGAESSVSSAGRIAYQGVEGDLSTGIFTVNLDGTDIQQVSAEGFQPAISPDGSMVAYASNSGIWLATF